MDGDRRPSNMLRDHMDGIECHIAHCLEDIGMGVQAIATCLGVHGIETMTTHWEVIWKGLGLWYSDERQHDGFEMS